MLDLVYVLVTLVFFTLMLAYVAACARLGQPSGADRGAVDESR